MDGQDVLPMLDSYRIEAIRPAVSIIIPTYNHLDLLKACLESIVKYTNLEACEVIVVANGCTDGTLEYLKTLPLPFDKIIYGMPLGFTKAANLGIRAARGDYVVLLNNDTVLLEQQKHLWVDMLLEPYRKEKKVGITGPVKFSFDCGGIERRAIAFWCAMIPRSFFFELGLLDEIFSPGMGEDGDFSIRVEEAGCRLVQVPEDGCAEFGKGIPNQKFPIFHHGSGTFGDKDYSDVKKRNDAILVERYGRKDVKKDDLETIYQMCLKHPCDTNELFPTLRAYAEKCDHITEFGVRGVFTTWAFLARRPKRMVSYDIEYNANIEGAKKEAEKAGISFEFRLENTLDAVIERTDLLFVDTNHTYEHLKGELVRHAQMVKKYILIHDTETYGEIGQDGGPGEKQAISEFLAAHPEWTQKEHMTISNGLTVLERNLLCSIVIPTCGKDWNSVLATCLKLVFDYTTMANKEVIVVANGAPPEAIAHLKTLPVRVLEFPERLGYIRAVNEGIKAAQSSHVVLLDDDSFLMPQFGDTWIMMLFKPFFEDAKMKMAAAGPFGQIYDDLGQVLHSGCTMYWKGALEKIGLFDEAFNPGYMGDEDLSIRLRKAGYNIARVPAGPEPRYVNGVFEIQFPVLHTGTVNTMDKHGADLPLVKKNRDLLYARHGVGGTYTIRPGMGFISPDGSSGYCGVSGFRGEAPSATIRTGPLVSIIIPTYKNNFYVDPQTKETWNILRKNLETLAEHTDLSQVEVIVVCNGCVDGQAEYVNSLGAPFRAISFEDAIGYTRATNEGIKVAKGEFLVLYNDDVVLLGQNKNSWLDILLEPYKGNPKMGITGPLQLHDDYADQDVIIGFCLCISRVALEAVGGLLDEVYSPGGGEDIDLCCKVRAKGFVVRQVPKEGKLGFSHTNFGNFPIWHVNNQTFKDIPEYTRFIVKKNGLVNAKKYNKNIKLNIGSGGIEHAGYLSVDLYDRRANIIMDVTQLDFPENSVAEILAVHVFEHLNPYHCLDILKRWHKILKPGGKLIMEMPDIEELCRRFVGANTGERYGILNAVYGSVNTTGDGDQSNITSPHLFGWWKQSLWDHLSNAGYTSIVFGPEQHPHPESNLRVEATKP